MKTKKFRVWDNVDYMSPPFTFQDVMEKKIQFTSDCPVMEYTGLFEDDVEICEGDILEYYQGYLTEVFFRNGSFMVYISDSQYLELSQMSGGYPIRGNKFQNPELKFKSPKQHAR